MGYLVATTGRLLLPPDLERQALTVAEHRMAAREGWFDPDVGHVDSLADLATYAGVTLTRHGDWLSVATDHDGDPKWSEQAEEFYRSLSEFVQQGEVHLRGEDGTTWSYAYSPAGLEQRGRNGWDDGEPVPGAQSGPATSEPLQSPEPPQSPESPGRPGPTSPPPPTDAGPPAAGSTPPEPPAPDAGYISYPGKEDRPPPRQQPPAAGPPGRGTHPSWGMPTEDEPPPASTGRLLAMTALLVVGVLLIIGLALLASGF